MMNIWCEKEGRSVLDKIHSECEMYIKNIQGMSYSVTSVSRSFIEYHISEVKIHFEFHKQFNGKCASFYWNSTLMNDDKIAIENTIEREFTQFLEKIAREYKTYYITHEVPEFLVLLANAKKISI